MSKKSCVTTCHSITHVVNLGSCPATLWRRLSLVAYLVHVYLYLPIMTACCMLKMIKKWHRNASRHRFAKIDQPNHRSASMFLLEYWCRLWIRLVAFWNARRLCRNFTLRIFLSKANVSTCKNRSLCVIAHMYTMKLITYGDGLSYRWLETYSVTGGYMKPVQCRNGIIYLAWSSLH